MRGRRGGEVRDVGPAVGIFHKLKNESPTGEFPLPLPRDSLEEERRKGDGEGGGSPFWLRIIAH